MSVNCSVCCQDLNPENEIFCDLCRGFVHTTCSDLSRNEIQYLKTKNRRLTYYCVSCSDFKQQLKKIHDLTSLVSTLQNEIHELKEQNKIRVISDVDSEAPDIFKMEKIVQEVTEREKRKNNLIIFNVPELDNGSRTDQIAADTVTVVDILRVVDISSDRISPIRLGKFDSTKQNRKRPIKITLPSWDDVITALRRNGRLKDSEKYKSIFLSKDRTPFQTSLYKTLKVQLSQRLAAGETGIAIKYVRDIPTIVKESHSEN